MNLVGYSEVMRLVSLNYSLESNRGVCVRFSIVQATNWERGYITSIRVHYLTEGEKMEKHKGLWGPIPTSQIR